MALYFVKGKSMTSDDWTLYCEEHSSHEALKRSLKREGEVEVPFACVKKLYPEVKWQDNISRKWIGK